MSTGFSYDERENAWNKTSFKANEKLLVVKASDEQRAKGMAWVVKYVGDDELADATCDADFDDRGFLICRGFSEFKFNRRTGRFLRGHLSGYWFVDPKADKGLFKEGALTPLIEIGKCSRIP